MKSYVGAVAVAMTVACSSSGESAPPTVEDASIGAVVDAAVTIEASTSSDVATSSATDGGAEHPIADSGETHYFDASTDGGSAREPTATSGRAPEAGTGAAGDRDADVSDAAPTSRVDPFATFTFEGAVYVVPVDGSRQPENVSARIERTGGADRWLVPSPSGTVFALSHAHSDEAAEILVRASADFSEITPVLAGGSEVYVEGMPAIVDSGDIIVFSASGGTHQRDLFVTREVNGSWSAPQELTAGSAAQFNNQPSLTREQDAVLFNCGDNADPESGGNSACRVALDGGQVEVVASPDALPNNRNAYVNFPREVTGGVVFESAWPQGEESPETIWQTLNGVTTPAVSRTFDNSVSPCVLPDDSLVLLWLGRPGGDGSHELTRVYPDGAYTVLWEGKDVADVGIGCTSRLSATP